MKFPVFGRRPSPPQPAAPSPAAATGAAHPGHRAVLDQLRRTEREQPLARPQLVGRLLFDMVCKWITDNRGVRAEDVLAILASTGGFSCLLAAFSETKGRYRAGDISLMMLRGRDGHRYFFGDRPNQYLIEGKFSLLGLALGAAQGCGGKVSLDMVHRTMQHVAGTVGAETFGLPQLPAENRPGDLPVNYVRHLWPKVLDAMLLYEVQPAQRPAAFGFALQRAIETGKDAIDPALAARIAVECAVPMARIDPERIARAGGTL